MRFSRFAILGFIWFIFLGCNCFAVEGRVSQGDHSSWLKLSEHGRLELWTQPSSGLLKIVDRKINLSWESGLFVPEGSAKKWIAANYWGMVYQSAFILRYLNDSGNMATILTGQPECQKRFAPSPSGGSFTFYFPDCQIGFQAIYTLGSDNNLRVVIPFRKISDPENRLLDIRVLPYFGSLKYHSRGYLLMPDGCGGIIKPDHFAQNYSPSRIYGERFYIDAQLINGQSSRSLHLADYVNPQNSFLTLPIFGAVKENGGFLGIISQGQFQAELGVEITPTNLWSAISPRLIFRETTYDILGIIHLSPVFDRRDRVVDYYFLVAPEASYVGIARKYRKILFASLRHPRLTVDQTQFRLRLFMGVNEQYLDTTRLICLTTFKQAETILKDLFQKGVHRLQVILVGWSNRGYLGDNPRHFPPDRRFGGINGLRKLLIIGRELGVSIGLQFDNSYTFKKSHGFNRGDTVKDIKGVPLDIGFGQKEYLLCPQLAWDRFLKNDLKMVRELKCDGSLLLGGLDQGLLNCYDKQHPVNHQAMALLIGDSFGKLSLTNPVAVTAASDFLYSNITAIYDLPANSSDNCDEAVPLIPIICHGKIPYSFEPINLRRDDRREFLKMVEYGAIPNAYLTAESVEELNYAKYNPIFSGKYSDWRGRLINEYRIYERDLHALQSLTIVDHQCLARDVYLTVYDDGAKIVVNYGPDAYLYDGKTVPPLNYAVMR